MEKYNVTTTKVEVEGVMYDTYGITGNGITINDISTERSKVEDFVAKINEVGDVDPIHIRDLVEDFLVDFSL